jgi:hypothetical protein
MSTIMHNSNIPCHSFPIHHEEHLWRSGAYWLLIYATHESLICLCSFGIAFIWNITCIYRKSWHGHNNTFKIWQVFCSLSSFSSLQLCQSFYCWDTRSSCQDMHAGLHLDETPIYYLGS